MSLIRFFRFTCDACGANEEREDYGFPKGWVFVKDMKVAHRCPNCQDSIPKDKKGYPKVIAKQ
jgi:hypothetical protein